MKKKILIFFLLFSIFPIIANTEIDPHCNNEIDQASSKDFDHLKIANLYADNNVACLSVLTEEKFFFGIESRVEENDDSQFEEERKENENGFVNNENENACPAENVVHPEENDVQNPENENIIQQVENGNVSIYFFI